MRVTFDEVNLSYGDRTVLHGLSFDWEGPAMIGLLGPSGSGKSSILALIGGLIPADSGEIRLTRDTESPLAWIFQSTPLLDRRSALENVMLGPRASGRSRDESRTAALRALAGLGMTERATKTTYVLSGGERQRVAVARAIASGASVICADEPTGALDAANRDQVADALLMASEHALVIVATHDLAVAKKCSTLLSLEKDAVGPNAESAS